MRINKEVVKNISSDLKFLLHWRQGLRFAGTRNISTHLNLIENAFYHAGLNENIHEEQINFIELLRNQKIPASNYMLYVMGTGRNRYEEKIGESTREWEHKTPIPEPLWRDLRNLNRYSHDTLHDRLRMVNSDVYQHRHAVNAKTKVRVPGIEHAIDLPQNSSNEHYQEYYHPRDYWGVINSVAAEISEILSDYPAHTLSEAQMNRKIVTHRRERGQQLYLDRTWRTPKHPWDVKFYKRGESQHNTPEEHDPNQLTLKL